MNLKKTIGLAFCALTLTLSTTALYADRPQLQDDATLTSLLQQLSGKNVEIQLTSGEKLAGTVKQVGQHILLLARLKGRDFFDAYIDVDDIVAIVISNQ